MLSWQGLKIPVHLVPLKWLRLPKNIFPEQGLNPPEQILQLETELAGCRNIDLEFPIGQGPEH